MADAKNLVGQLPEAVAERQVGSGQDLGTKSVGGMSFGQTYGRERRRIFRRVAALDLEAPMLDAAAGCFRGTVMAGEDVVESLLMQQPDSDAQSLQQIRGRR